MIIEQIKKLLGHTFLVDSNIKNAKVTFIVDPYNRKKDITSQTPCKISIPWEPRRKQANKHKVLIEKEGYIPKVVELQTSKKIFVNLMIIGIIVGIIGGYLYYKLQIPLFYFIVVYLYLMCNLSLGSGDLYIELDSKG